MMDKKALVEKIGVLLDDLQASYRRISQGLQEINPLEVELFEVNSIYFSEHTKILTKLQQEETPAGAAVDSGQSALQESTPQSGEQSGEQVSSPVENPEVEETIFTPQTKDEKEDTALGNSENQKAEGESETRDTQSEQTGSHHSDREQPEAREESDAGDPIEEDSGEDSPRDAGDIEENQDRETQADRQSSGEVGDAPQSGEKHPGEEDLESEGGEEENSDSADAPENAQADSGREEEPSEAPSGKESLGNQVGAEASPEEEGSASASASEPDVNSEEAESGTDDSREQEAEAGDEEVEESEVPMEEADHKAPDAQNERHTFRFNFSPEAPEKQESFTQPDAIKDDTTGNKQNIDFDDPSAQSHEVRIEAREVSIEPEPGENTPAAQTPEPPREEPPSTGQTRNGAAAVQASSGAVNSLQQQASRERPLSLNERLSAQRRQQGQSNPAAMKPELKRIKDIKSAVSLNDKLLFIKDLFNGYSLAYSEAMELLNRCGNFQEADEFLQNNYAAKNNWGSKQDTVNKLYDILKKRYGSY